MNVPKKCPFCGAVPTTEVRVTQMGGGEDHIDFSIVCEECGISKTSRLKIKKTCKFFDIKFAMSDVLEAWNRRANHGND